MGNGEGDRDERSTMAYAIEHGLQNLSDDEMVAILRSPRLSPQDRASVQRRAIAQARRRQRKLRQMLHELDEAIDRLEDAIGEES